MTNKAGLFFLVLGFFGLLFGCQMDQQRVYEHYKSLKDYRWAYQDTLGYKVDIKDTSSRYRLAIQLRNKVNYPYRNIWVLVQHHSPSGKVSSMKAEFQLAEKSGKWKGQGLGDLYDHRFPLQQNIKLKEKGQHRFQLVHLMRRDTLPGIMNVGLQISKP